MKRLAFGAIVGLGCLFGVLFLTPSSASAVSCADQVPKSTVDAILAQGPLASPANWTCQWINTPDPNQANKCAVSSMCSDGSYCCPPGVGSTAPVATPASSAAQGSAKGLVAFIPASCLRSGDCSLEDIIKTAVSFVNFLFGISGAILLLIFVYAGVLYLFGGIDPDGIAKAKKMIKGSVIGIIIMFGAHTIIRFFVQAFLGS
jgi:hypothetical protein